VAAATTLPAVRAEPPVAAASALLLRRSFVAGSRYYQAHDVFETLQPGQALILRRQPDNKYDSLAIEVLTTEGVKLGYVPRIDNEPFARLIDAGQQVTAQIEELASGQYEDIRIALFLYG
jgi:hypothetical protein